MEIVFFLLSIAFINSLMIIGLFNAATFDYCHPDDCKENADYCDDKCIDKYSKMILWRLRYYSIKYFGDFWSKPIITCQKCMASVHSIYVYFYFNKLTLNNLLLYPFYILLLSGIIVMLTSNKK